VEALFLDRNTPCEPVVIRVQDEGNVFPFDTVLAVDDLNFDSETGVRAVVGNRIDECHSWETGYLGVFDLDGSVAATGNNDLALPGELGVSSLDFFAADRIQLDYGSELHSAELNHLRVVNDDLSLLMGFRYLSFDEEFNINSTDADTGSSDYQIDTNNDLYGGQIGAQYLKSRGRFGWGATAKAGVFGNDSSQRQFITDFPRGSFLRPERSSSGGHTAFVGELNLSHIYHFSEVLSFRAGYTLLWIEGVALASDQLDFTNSPISGTGLSHGGVFLHGVHLGLTAVW
jgi:hypothetical protein